ncbi:Uncharacterized protein APZ42_025490 [Daphnia magna]|uniref:Uncharacterized protein n=1 Tax=Daphnia magna TaxID=35525 RepID=A0A164T0S1_9CRUS|nr:Uncharacterized protein APZ42_025490 [Daphnia magna]
MISHPSLYFISGLGNIASIYLILFTPIRMSRELVAHSFIFIAHANLSVYIFGARFCDRRVVEKNLLPSSRSLSLLLQLLRRFFHGAATLNAAMELKNAKGVLSYISSRRVLCCQMASSQAPGLWPTETDINDLEFLAALNGWKAFTSRLRNLTISLMLDNFTAVHYINKSGRTKSPAGLAISAITAEIVA